MDIRTKYKLTIEPAIPPNTRQGIEKFLETVGYEVYGGGTWNDMSSCDITFSDGEKDEEREKNQEYEAIEGIKMYFTQINKAIRQALHGEYITILCPDIMHKRAVIRYIVNTIGIWPGGLKVQTINEEEKNEIRIITTSSH